MLGGWFSVLYTMGSVGPAFFVGEEREYQKGDSEYVTSEQLEVRKLYVGD